MDAALRELLLSPTVYVACVALVFLLLVVVPGVWSGKKERRQAAHRTIAILGKCAASIISALRSGR